jgi:hypothetical protein
MTKAMVSVLALSWWAHKICAMAPETTPARAHEHSEQLDFAQPGALQPALNLIHCPSAWH